MADWTQFGDFEAGSAARPAACSVCEAMLPDAVDGALSAAEQRAFDQHVAGCVACAKELEEAQRGAAWLSMLKTQTPEPPADLLAKILAGTTGAAIAHAAMSPAVPAMRDEAPREWATHGTAGHSANGIGVRLAAFGRKLADVFSIENSRMTFQPRLAMTAAMAFFSIALTLNLTGVRLRDMRASDFTPGGIRRTVADAGASAARSFQNMRVVYQVESRVSELRNDQTFGHAPSDEQAAPSGSSDSKSNDGGTASPQGGKTQGGDDSKPQDSKPKGRSDLVLPLPERMIHSGTAPGKEI